VKVGQIASADRNRATRGDTRPPLSVLLPAIATRAVRLGGRSSPQTERYAQV